MFSIINLFKNKQKEFFLLVLVIGFISRIAVSKLGYQADIEWWVFVNDINTANGKFYGTGSVLYTHIIVHIFYRLDSIPFF